METQTTNEDSISNIVYVLLDDFQRLARDVLAEYGTTPEKETASLASFIHSSRSEFDGLLLNPLGVTCETTEDQAMNRRRIAVILWQQCSLARDYIAVNRYERIDMILLFPHPRVTLNRMADVELFAFGFGISRFVTALLFPAIQDKLMRGFQSRMGKQGKDAEQARFKIIREFCEATAKKSWAENTDEEGKPVDPDPPAHMAKFIFDVIKDPRVFGLTEKPSIDQIKGWIKPCAPEKAKRSGRPRKR